MDAFMRRLRDGSSDTATTLVYTIEDSLACVRSKAVVDEVRSSILLAQVESKLQASCLQAMTASCLASLCAVLLS